ncbi:S41 family peptidase [Mucilaginibacter koreensis]
MFKLVKPICLLWFVVITLTANAQVTDSLTLSDKIYGLSKFWSEVNYNFVYLYKVDAKAWDKAYRQAIDHIQLTKNDYEYYRELQKLCAILKDGHTQVYLPEQIEKKMMLSSFGNYKIVPMNVAGRVLVVQTNKSKAEEVPFGSEIIKVNGLNTQDYLNGFVKPYISVSTTHELNNKAAYSIFNGFAGDKFDIEIRTPKGLVKSLHLTHAPVAETEVYPAMLGNQPNFEWKWLKNKIAYIAINTFNDAGVVKEFTEKLPELKTATAIIIDVRNNGGGSARNAKNIAKYFIKGNLLYGEKTYSREIIPTDRGIGSFLVAQDTINGKAAWGLNAEAAKAYYKAYAGSKFHEYPFAPDTLEKVEKLSVPTVILTGNYTTSAAEDFLVFLDGQPHIKRLGEYTSGSTGQPLQIDLPGNTTAWICTKRVTFSDGREFVGTGIKPDVLVERTANDILYPKENDSQLEMAVKYLMKNK